MNEPVFDHDRLDVYRLSIDYVAASFADARSLEVRRSNVLRSRTYLPQPVGSPTIGITN